MPSGHLRSLHHSIETLVFSYATVWLRFCDAEDEQLGIQTRNKLRGRNISDGNGYGRTFVVVVNDSPGLRGLDPGPMLAIATQTRSTREPGWNGSCLIVVMLTEEQ